MTGLISTRLRLDAIIDPTHPLAVLACRIPWAEVAARVRPAMSIGAPGAPPGRLMAALLYLQRVYLESETSVVARWAQDVYFQHFSGQQYFEPRKPCEASRLLQLRRDLGESGVANLLADMAAREAEGERPCATPCRERVELEMLRHVLRDSPDFISFCRLDDTYIEVNPGFERFVGLPREQIIGRTALDIGLWPSAAPRDAFIRELLSKGRLLGYNKLLSRSTGEPRDIEGWASLVEVDGEKVLVAIGRDVTDRRRDERELQLHREHLQQLVDQRTHELTEANQRLQVANKAKSAFLASMSHELRTPLGAILGYAQLLQMGRGLTERQLSGINTIQQSGEHLLALIDDILDLARVEAGKLQLQPTAVDLPSFLGVVVDIMRVRAEDKGLMFRYEPPFDLPGTVLVDERRLRQILLNLLGNAVKYTDAGEVTLGVSSRPDGGRVKLRFDVVDSGIGLAPEALERLFLPFEQLSDARHRAGGAGLGLSISQAMARLMGGEISAKSAPGQGSCFSFEVDVATLDVVAPAPRDSRQVTGYAGMRRRVLIVDDIEANHKMLADMLQLLGFETATAENGLQALSKAESFAPDLILMDVLMPVMDGLDATRRLRAAPRTSGTPIVVVSAGASKSHAEQCVAAGADEFLSKPVAIPLLLERIGALLDLKWMY